MKESGVENNNIKSYIYIAGVAVRATYKGHVEVRGGCSLLLGTVPINKLFPE